jgi:hypothetical protein
MRFMSASGRFVAKVGALRAAGMPFPLALRVSTGLDARVEVRSSACAHSRDGEERRSGHKLGEPPKILSNCPKGRPEST